MIYFLLYTFVIVALFAGKAMHFKDEITELNLKYHLRYFKTGMINDN